MKKKSIVSELFPWLNRRAIVESDFDTSIEPHPTHPPIMPDVEREPEVDHTTNDAQEFLAISLALGEEAEFRTEHYVQHHVDGGIKRVSVSYH
jgi:hypothetical protein